MVGWFGIVHGSVYGMRSLTLLSKGCDLMWMLLNLVSLARRRRDHCTLCDRSIIDGARMSSICSSLLHHLHSSKSRQPSLHPPLPQPSQHSVHSAIPTVRASNCIHDKTSPKFEPRFNPSRVSLSKSIRDVERFGQDFCTELMSGKVVICIDRGNSRTMSTVSNWRR